jgi:hypothetical protein
MAVNEGTTMSVTLGAYEHVSIELERCRTLASTVYGHLVEKEFDPLNDTSLCEQLLDRLAKLEEFVDAEGTFKRMSPAERDAVGKGARHG